MTRRALLGLAVVALAFCAVHGAPLVDADASTTSVATDVAPDLVGLAPDTTRVVAIVGVLLALVSVLAPVPPARPPAAVRSRGPPAR